MTFRLLITENTTEKAPRLHIIKNPQIEVILNSYCYETQDEITITVKSKKCRRHKTGKPISNC